MKIPIHREGWPFIGAFLIVTVLLFWLAGPMVWLGAILSLWCIWFFRDPERDTPIGSDLIVSPADGMVLPLVYAPPPEELGMEPQPRLRISIFMNVFDVHVNRSPVDGVVAALAYRPGRFFNASLDKASLHNERMAAWIRTEDARGAPRDLAVVQIAGLIARRIKCYLQRGEGVRRGARYGIIRFGSRLDIYLPEGTIPRITAGQRVRAGETVLAQWPGGDLGDNSGHGEAIGSSAAVQ